MSKCIKCGAQFIKSPESPPAPDKLCRFCEIEELKRLLIALMNAAAAMLGQTLELERCSPQASASRDQLRDRVNDADKFLGGKGEIQ